MTSGGRELLKWLALALMTGDHVNKVLFAGTLPWATEIARVVFPIFAVVLVCNIVTHHDSAAGLRSYSRLLVAAAVVQPLHAIAFGYWLPVNVLGTLALGLYVSATPHLGRALVAWAVLGAFVDFQWAGVGVVLAATVWFRRPGRAWSWLVVAGAAAGLCWWNGNAWALLALPLIAGLGRVDLSVPRWRWTFLGYYAAHLAVLAICTAG